MLEDKIGHYVTKHYVMKLFKLKTQQFLQEPTYQLSKEPDTDILHLLCFLLLLQKKSVYLTLIASKKILKKSPSPTLKIARLGRKEKCFPPVCQIETRKSKAGGKKEVIKKANSWKRNVACELISTSLLK